MRSKQSGFTLVEIAIVLVIIGLLLGGVLKGQELINSAKVKNIANDLNGIAAGVYAYQDRYKAFPGDDSAAVARWALTAGRQGDKNGVVGTTTTNFNGTDVSENTFFWQHMRHAGFVAGDKTNGEQPRNTLGGIVGVQTGTGVAATPDLGGLVVCTSNLPGKIAEAIDLQFDDGIKNAGNLRGYNQNSSFSLTAAGTPVSISDTATDNPTRPTSADTATTYASANDIVLYTICKAL